MSGIYIPGMEMPKNCFDCPLFDDVYTDADGDDDYSCGLGVPLDYYQASGETKKDCPLVPAADVRPVVKARWVYTDKSRLVCSNCGNPVAFSLKEDGWHHGDFCPNCGADMRPEPPKEEKYD